MSFYGSSPMGNRPGCWGDPRVYDSENRECRGCGFQTSCRDQVIKLTQIRQQTVPQVNMTPPYYQQQFPQTQYAQPVPLSLPAPAPIQIISPQQQQQPIQVQRYPAPVAPALPPPVPYQRPPQQQQQMPVQSFVSERYGRVQDPLFFTILAAPPVFRPQMDGETSWERFAKNVLLDMGTMILFHGGLFLRQLFLPPRPHSVDMTGQVVDGVVQRGS